jgi:hypothetical protein
MFCARVRISESKRHHYREPVAATHEPEFSVARLKDHPFDQPYRLHAIEDHLKDTDLAEANLINALIPNIECTPEELGIL